VQQLPGQRLFQYVDDDGQLQPVDSGMVNEYLHAACSNGQTHEFSAKDFRTWGGTVHAARVLAGTPRPGKGGEPARRRALAKAIGEVAAILGNTPAVCRGSYIHPRILDGWLDGSLQRAIPAATAAHPRKLEQQVLRFLR
jgi:DNA topoisomerase I